MTGYALTHPESLDEERLRKYGADFTPMPVVRQCLAHAGGHSTVGRLVETARVCDPAAGAGAWALGMRERWPSAHVTALEVREEERDHLARAADEVCITDALTWAEAYAGPSFDVAATNPDFKLFAKYAEAFLPIAREVWLFAPIDTKLRGEEGFAWLNENARFVRRALWQPGPISFREGGKADHRQYALWMLSSCPAGRADGWPVHLLPWLPGRDRKWVTRPGTAQEA